MAKKTQAAKKRKVSGKRGSAARRKTQQGTDPRGVIGIAVLCLGLLALASQFIASTGGFILACRNVSRGLGGSLCLLLPLVVCWAGVVLVFFKEQRMSVKTMLCGAVLFLLVETLLQLFQIQTISSSILAGGGALNYGRFLLVSYQDAVGYCTGGGLIGALLAWPLMLALDIWGGVIVLIFAMTIDLMILTGVSFGNVGMYLSEWLDDWRVARQERREEKEALRAAKEEEAQHFEDELARRRREKREGKKSESEMPEAEAADEPAQTPEQEEKPPRQRKKKKAAQPAPEEEEAPAEPEIVLDQPAQRPAQRRKYAPQAPVDLYIERGDEFERSESEEPYPMSTGVQTAHYDAQEADDAFLHGISGRGASRPAYGEPEYDEPLPQGEAYDETGYAEEAYDEPAYEEPVYEEPAYEEPAYEEPAYDEPAYDEPAYEEPVYDAPLSEPAAPRRRTRSRQTPAGTVAPAAQLAAKWAGTREEEDGEKTIVQLRGNRLDGTPLVVPAKDTHESVKQTEEVYCYPPLDLLDVSTSAHDPNQRAKDEAGARKLIGTLESFGVQAKMLNVTHGPAITRYELQPAPGVKVSRIVNLVDDIALNMASDGVRIEAPIPGKPAVGIEIPNEKIGTVTLREVLESPEMTREKSPTAVALGKGISGAPVIADMAKMPHVLIAGATGSGKSVCINTIINSIIYRASPREVRLILIDPKVVELSVYNGIPHLLVPVVTDPKKASAALSWAVVEMDHRYKRFETMGVRDIRGYNKAIGPDEEPMSKIIVIIDELADLMMVAPGEVEDSICRLAQLARAAGIHLVIATQRPSVNVITGVIKANIPSRVAFAVSSQIDSRTILDNGGAEKLLGRGDMLYAPQGAGKPTRVQGCYVSDEEVLRIVDYVRGQHSADYNEDVIEQMNTTMAEEKGASSDVPAGAEPVDEMLLKAIELAVDAGQVSISMLQRRLRVGYARAGRLVDEMTLRGITAEAEGPTKPRTVLISREDWRRMQENQE